MNMQKIFFILIDSQVIVLPFTAGGSSDLKSVVNCALCRTVSDVIEELAVDPTDEQAVWHLIKWPTVTLAVILYIESFTLLSLYLR